MSAAANLYVESRPEKCGGKPCIAGTRIRVWDIYVWHELCGMTPDDIVSEFPELNLSQVHAALSYFWDHQDEVRSQVTDEANLMHHIRAAAGPSLLELLAPTDGTSPRSSAAQHDSLSP